jgi:small subunit ribosomal protein S20
MANTKSAAKRTRQTARRAERNTSVKTALKGSQKKLRLSLEAKDSKAAKTDFSELTSKLDKAAKRGVIHRNAAARKKSRSNKALAAASK